MIKISWILFFLLLVSGCVGGQTEADWETQREHMVRETIQARGIQSEAVLRAMRTVPRHLFVPESYRASSYRDSALPIEHGQTISQPYIVALMTELAQLEPGDRVLEVGTGSGYQAAVLAEMGVEVYSVEILEPLAEQAGEKLEQLGYSVTVRAGDGYRGWPEHAPFQAVLITAAPDQVPRPLLEQLAEGGRLVVPEGDQVQTLRVYTRQGEDFEMEEHGLVRFVPMTGEAERD